MALGGILQVSAAAVTQLLNPATDGGPFKMVRVTCDPASTSNLLVRIPEIHGTQFVPLTPGESEVFNQMLHAGGDRMARISRVEVRGDGGDAIVRWRVLSR